jgi:perosamine synthetase
LASASAEGWSRTLAAVDNAFIRRHPWRIHFFNETWDGRDAANLLAFLARREPLDDGPALRQYEHMFRDVIDPAGFAYAYGAGRMALFALLEAFDIGRGDEVIVPPFTCEAVVQAILYRGCVPVYADIEPATFNLDPASLQASITPRSRAVIAQHTFGVPCNLDAIRRVAAVAGLRVIEDCALAIGASYRGRPVGVHGDGALFSTDRTKVLSTFYGGMAFTRHADVAARLAAIQARSPFLSRGALRNIAFQALASWVLYQPALYPLGRPVMAVGYRTGLLFGYRPAGASSARPAGYPCRLSNMQAVMGMRQLQKLPSILARRAATVRTYREILAGNGVMVPQPVPDFVLRFPLLLRDRPAFVHRWRKYFEVGTWFDGPAVGWAGTADQLGYRPGSCPVAEFIHRHIVNFPTHQTSERVQAYLYRIMDTLRPEEVACDGGEAFESVAR